MIALNPRHSRLERRVLRWCLILLLLATAFGLAFQVAIYHPGPSETTCIGSARFEELEEEALLSSQPIEYHQELKAWQDAVDYEGFAGAVVETTKGQILAGASAFLDASGRQYHDHDSTLDGSQIIEELGTRDIQIHNQQGKRVSGRIRFFTFSPETAP